MDNSSKEYAPLFELGIVNDNPAVKVIAEVTVCPVSLAALMVTLFETVMKSIEENEQIEYEKYFNKSFKKIMKERHNYEIYYRYLKVEEEDEE